MDVRGPGRSPLAVGLETGLEVRFLLTSVIGRRPPSSFRRFRRGLARGRHRQVVGEGRAFIRVSHWGRVYQSKLGADLLAPPPLLRLIEENFQGQAADGAQVGALLRAEAIIIAQTPFFKGRVPNLPSLLLAFGAPAAH